MKEQDGNQKLSTKIDRDFERAANEIRKSRGEQQKRKAVIMMESRNEERQSDDFSC